MRNNKVVYAYFDKEECFYIGIGTPRRPYQEGSCHRNKFTRSKIVNSKKSNTFHIQILHTGLTAKQACWYERMYIRAIGRRDLGLGTLTNLTDGGEGSKGHKGYWKGKNRSEKTKEKLRQANLGKILPEKQKQRLREYMSTDKNPMKGKTGGQHNRSKSVMTPKGKFDSVEQAAKAYSTYQQQIGYWCKSHTKKYSGFCYIS